MHFEKRKSLFLQLGFAEQRLIQLKQHIDLLWSSNEELNLISRKMTYEELIDNHVIDCLLPLKMFPENVQNVSDFGSGGGLPAVIYAIHFTNKRFSLFEKSPKKQEFLSRCQKIAPNLQIESEIPQKLPETDIITARAFKPIDVILELSQSYYKSGGKYFLLKGRQEKINEEIVLAKKKHKNLKVEMVPLKSPVMDVERHLVVIN